MAQQLNIPDVTDSSPWIESPEAEGGLYSNTITTDPEQGSEIYDVSGKISPGGNTLLGLVTMSESPQRTPAYSYNNSRRGSQVEINIGPVQEQKNDQLDLSTLVADTVERVKEALFVSFEVSSMTPSNLPSPLRTKLKQERCPLCLSGDVRGPASLKSKRPGGLDKYLVVLQCKRLKCYHIVHMDCILSEEGACYSKLQKSHSTSRFQSTPALNVEADVHKTVDGHSVIVGSRRGCTFELLLLHNVSSAIIYHTQSDMQSVTDQTGKLKKRPVTVSGVLDVKTNREFVYLDQTMNESDFGSTFFVTLGRILFMSICPSTQEVWEIEASYDLTACDPLCDGTELIFIHPQLDVTMTVLLLRSQLKTNGWEIKHVFLELGEQIQMTTKTNARHPTFNFKQEQALDFGIAAQTPNTNPARAQQLTASPFMIPVQPDTPQVQNMMQNSFQLSGGYNMAAPPESPFKYGGVPSPLSANPPRRPIMPSGVLHNVAESPMGDSGLRTLQSWETQQSQKMHVQQSEPNLLPRPEPSPLRILRQASLDAKISADKVLLSPHGGNDLLRSILMELHLPANGGQGDEFVSSLDSVAKVAQCQVGSRYLQQRFENCTSKEDFEFFNVVFEELKTSFAVLMLDLFGNYLCQKMIKLASSAQRAAIIRNILPDLVKISCDRQGTRSMQRLVEMADTDEEYMLIINSVLPTQQNQPETGHMDASKLLVLMRNPNGAHVVHAMLAHFPLKLLNPIFDVCLTHIASLATHQYGLCVLKQCIVLAPPAVFFRFAALLLDKIDHIVNDQYGNYVMQYVIQRCNSAIQGGGSYKNNPNPNAKDATFDAVRTGPPPTKEEREQFIACLGRAYDALCGNFYKLSTHKYSSNVVEKLLSVEVLNIQVNIIGEFLECDQIPSLLEDSFGNYVMQKALDKAIGQQAAGLLAQVEASITTLRRNVQKKWKRLFNDKRVSMGMQPKFALLENDDLDQTNSRPNSHNNSGSGRNERRHSGGNRRNSSGKYNNNNNNKSNSGKRNSRGHHSRNSSRNSNASFDDEYFGPWDQSNMHGGGHRSRSNSGNQYFGFSSGGYIENDTKNEWPDTRGLIPNDMSTSDYVHPSKGYHTGGNGNRRGSRQKSHDRRGRSPPKQQPKMQQQQQAENSMIFGYQFSAPQQQQQQHHHHQNYRQSFTGGYVQQPKPHAKHHGGQPPQQAPQNWSFDQSGQY